MFKMLSEQLVSLRKDISTLHKDVEELKMVLVRGAESGYVNEN